MELSGQLFDGFWLLVFAAVYAAFLLRALRWANWRRLRDSEQLNVFLGVCVALMVLWVLRTEIQPGLHWHLSGMVLLSLMFGWSFAVLGGSLVLLAMTIAGLNDWNGFAPSALMQVVLPATLAMAVLGLVRAYLPRHPFVFIFVNAFLTGGLVTVLETLATTGLLLSLDAISYDKLSQTYLLFLPLMFFPEGVFNGWMTAILVGYKPDWLSSFDDDDYLQGS